MPKAIQDSTQFIATRAFSSLPEQKREAVFQAAVEEFADHGYSAASMNSLARSAGISKGSLFQYFRRKSALFDGLVGVAFSRVKAYLRDVRDETAGMALPSRLERLLRAGFQFIDDHPKLARIYFRLLQSGDAPFGRERLAYFSGRGQQFLADLLAEAQARGEVRTDLDVQHTAFLLNAMLERLLRAYYTEHLDPEHGIYRARPATRDAWITSFVEFVQSGLAAVPSSGATASEPHSNAPTISPPHRLPGEHNQ